LSHRARSSTLRQRRSTRLRDKSLAQPVAAKHSAAHVPSTHFAPLWKFIRGNNYGNSSRNTFSPILHPIEAGPDLSRKK
jgi:hypothetical protein